MEVKSTEWKQRAIDNITEYVHRGGDCDGDNPELIGGAKLLNTIGVAMSLPVSNPEKWSESEIEKSKKGELVCYKNDARKAIDVIANQMRACCGGSDLIYITVLPVVLYFQGKMYRLPVFRVQRFKNSCKYYVDNIGRVYNSVNDWYNCNKLPPGEMIYPSNLKLFLRSDFKAHTTIAATPLSRSDSKTARNIDIVAAIAGLTSSVASIFVTGGLAVPLVATGIAAASWGTGRSITQVSDKTTHGESVNPFTNSESRLLWLGIAANLTSFGAMGATMRLTSLTARGRQITTTMRVLTDVANGTNMTVSGLAIVNSTIFMIDNHKDLTPLDILMQGMSIAFWSKGVFTYKTTKTMIRDVQNNTLAAISKDMTVEEIRQFSYIRELVGNDELFLQKIHTAMNRNISIRTYSQLIIDSMEYYDIASRLNREQIDALMGLRNYVRDDLKLLSTLRTFSTNHNLNPRETINVVVNMLQQLMSTSHSEGSAIILSGGNVVVGRAPPIRINQLPLMSPPMIKFIGEHLSGMDMAASGQWSASITVLFNLQEHGMFTFCAVSRVVTSGRAVISLNDNLHISIHKLHAMPEGERSSIFSMVGRLRRGIASSALPIDVIRLCVREQRLRFECHRSESVTKVIRNVRQYPLLRKLVQDALKSYEKDRLYTFLSDVEMYKADAYMTEMMEFVSDMKPANISEMVAYSEFVMTCVEDHALSLKQKIRSGEMQKPKTKISVWTRNEAVREVFRNPAVLKQRFADVLKTVRDNNMVGTVVLASGLSNQQLVAAVRRQRVTFGGEVSAAYHIVKHPTTPLRAYVTRANETIRNAVNSWTVSLGQDGDTRSVNFEDQNGKSILLERDGHVCTFMPK